jgi:carbamoyl-phosphate synthase large subunit
MNILLTSAGRRSYIVDYFKACEGVDKVFVCNSSFSIACKRADGYFISPLIYDKEYIPSLLDFCISNNITFLLSLFDIDLLVLAKNRQLFQTHGIQLVLAPESFIKICNDKWQTFQFINSIGLKAPRSFLRKEEILRELSSGTISYPVIIKPRWGMASIGVYKVFNARELDVLSERCKRDISNSYLKYESSFTSDYPIIYQEFLYGEEYGLDVLNDLKGHFVATFPKQKITMRSGETDLGRTTCPSAFIDLSKRISQFSSHEGILSVDCIKNGLDIFIIEMNCRISGHYPLSYLAGFNYPQLLINWLLGKGTDKELLRFEENLLIIKDLVPAVLLKQ